MEKTRRRKDKVDVNYREISEDVSSTDVSTGRRRRWHWKDFLKDQHWFETVCNLPNKGLIPEKIPCTLVSDKMLEECFEKRSMVIAHGYKPTPRKIISSSDVEELLQIVEGSSDRRSRDRISAPLAKGIYADKVLGMSVNWAFFAHQKHKYQLQRACNAGRPPPCAPPLLRVPIRYKQSLRLDLEAEDFIPKGISIESKFQAERECTKVFESGGCKSDPIHVDSRGSLRTDAAVPTEERIASPCSPESDVPGRDKAHAADKSRSEAPPDNTKNLDTEAPVGNLFNLKQPLLSVLTPDRIQLEISRLVQQQKKLRDDISTLRVILEVVSERDQKQGPSMEGLRGQRVRSCEHATAGNVRDESRL